eukprot:240721-Pyramimonas_sp.AAC.1
MPSPPLTHVGRPAPPPGTAAGCPSGSKRPGARPRARGRRRARRPGTTGPPAPGRRPRTG